MSVTASFDPSRVASEPGMAAALTLRLHNDATSNEIVRLRAAGALAQHTVLQSETIYLDANETFDVPVVVDVGAGLVAGPHSSTVEVLDEEGRVAGSAEATIDVVEQVGYAVALVPEHSRSAAAGRHRVVIQNTGNTQVAVELTPFTTDGVVVELATQIANVVPGDTAQVEVRVIPPSRFWTGPSRSFGFSVHTLGSDGAAHEVHGTFEQGPRIRSWFVPALVGTLLALLLGTLAWFTLLKPYVDDTAEDAAADAIFEDRAALRERIAELEAAAAEAEELPLGEPVDFRLAATAAPGSAASDVFAVSSSRLLSVTDIVLQNPTGAVGRVTLLRDGVILLESELANFRDLDLHFVAPFRFEGSTQIELRVACTEPGPLESDCPVAATVIGFVDEAR